MSDYLTGAPELVTEIAASSASIDLRDKLNAYRRNGVKEYLTWRTLENQFDWRILAEGEFDRRPRTPKVCPAAPCLRGSGCQFPRFSSATRPPSWFV